MKEVELMSGFTVLVPTMEYNLLMKIKQSNKKKIPRDSLNPRTQHFADKLVSYQLLNRDDENYYPVRFVLSEGTLNIINSEHNEVPMKLSKSDKKSLHIINETLKNEHGFTVEINESVSKEKLNKIRRDFINEMREISHSKDPQSNPEYSQCSLVVEATNILLGRKKSNSVVFNEDRQSKVHQLEQLEDMLGKIKDTHPEKALVIENKINDLKEKIFVESKEQELRNMLNEDAQQAEVIMAAKGMFDNVHGFQSKVGEMMNKTLDPFIERVRTVYGSDVADKMYTNMMDALSGIMDEARAARGVFSDSIAVLSGDKDSLDDSIGNEESEAQPSLEDDDLDLSVDGEADDADVDIDLELDLDDTSEDESEPEEEFTRREE